VTEGNLTLPKFITMENLFIYRSLKEELDLKIRDIPMGL